MQSFTCKIVSILLVCIYLGTALPSTAGDIRFEKAKRTLHRDRTFLLDALKDFSGGAAVLAVGGQLLYYYLHYFKSISQTVAALPVPDWSRSPEAQKLLKEKTRLQKEAVHLENIYKMILRKEVAAGKNPAERRHVESLKQILKERYRIFDVNMRRYQQDYQKFIQERSMPVSATRVTSRVSSSAMSKNIFRQTLKKSAGKTPLVVLVLWLFSSGETARASVQARRLVENPSLILTLSAEQEKEIEHSKLLQEIYIHIADRVHELASLSKEEMAVLVGQMREKEEVSRGVKKLLFREKLKRELSR